MKRTLICTLEIDLEEMPDDEREAQAKLEKETPDNLPSVADLEPHEVADAARLAVETSEEFFSGSNMYAKIAAVRVGNHGWKTTTTPKKK